MNTPPEIPPIVSSGSTITYELTRMDVFAIWMTVIFRNRILQVFVVVALIFNLGLTLGPGIGVRSLGRTLFDAVVYVIGFLAFLAMVQAILGLANALLLKHHGVLGRHTLEITAQGLVERTEYNETVHRWPAICRIVSLGGYLYIYVSDNNAHAVPKRCFTPEAIRGFEADLRDHIKQSTS